MITLDVTKKGKNMKNKTTVKKKLTCAQIKRTKGLVILENDKGKVVASWPFDSEIGSALRWQLEKMRILK